MFFISSVILVQVDQGLGIGSKFPFFNRHQLTLTRFFQLMEVEEGAGKPPPPVLVLHGHYGGCVGDLPSYDAFTLGGPYSVRGYNMGEIGAARNILEVKVIRDKYMINSLLVIIYALQELSINFSLWMQNTIMLMIFMLLSGSTNI